MGVPAGMTALAEKAEVLWVGDDPVPAELVSALSERWHISRHRPDSALSGQLAAAAAVLVQLNGLGDDSARLESLLDELAAEPTVAVLLMPSECLAQTQDLVRRRGDPAICMPTDAPGAEL